MNRNKSALFSTGDINAFFGLMLDNIHVTATGWMRGGADFWLKPELF